MMRMNIISFDIESWFLSYKSSQIDTSQWLNMESRIEKNLDLILNLLSEHNTIGTFYILGWVAEQQPEVVKRIAEAGHEIGYHSYYHQMPVNQGPEAFEKTSSTAWSCCRESQGRMFYNTGRRDFRLGRIPVGAFPFC